MKRIILVSILLSILIIACKTKKDSVSNSGLQKTETGEQADQMTLLEKSYDSIQRDNYEVHSYSIIGDVLEIFVSYGGGCGEVDFELYYTQKVMNSMPPQTVLHLGFTDNDPCRSVETRKLIFSMEPFKVMAEDGGIWLILGGSDLRQLYKVDKIE